VSELNNDERENYLKISALWLKQSKSIQRIRELHKGDPDNICTQCGYLYPCLTIEALDGEQE
jgi:hypothetical protein